MLDIFRLALHICSPCFSTLLTEQEVWTVWTAWIGYQSVCLPPVGCSRWEAPVEERRVGVKWGLKFYFSASLPMRSQLQPDSLLYTIILSRSCSPALPCALPGLSVEGTLCYASPSALLHPSLVPLNLPTLCKSSLSTVIFTPLSHIIRAYHQFPDGTMTDAKSKHSLKDLIINDM